MIKSAHFQQLISELKGSFESDPSMTDIKKITVLNSLWQMRYRDETVLEKACSAFMASKTLNVQTMTNLLYILAKFKYAPFSTQKDGEKNAFFLKCSTILKSELALSSDLACRNLWNFYALNYYEPELFDLLGSIIVKHHDKLSEIDVANAFKAFAFFKHTQTEQAAITLESLVRRTIREVNGWRMQTIAQVSNSLADLDVQNTTIFGIIKNIIMTAEQLDNNADVDGQQQDVRLNLNPVDCA